MTATLKRYRKAEVDEAASIKRLNMAEKAISCRLPLTFPLRACYSQGMRTQTEITEDNQRQEDKWNADVKAWEARRAQEWKRLEGIPQGKPFVARVHIGSSMFAPIIRTMRVIMTANKNGQPVLKPIDGTGKYVRCVLPNGQGKRQFGVNQLVEII